MEKIAKIRKTGYGFSISDTPAETYDIVLRQNGNDMQRRTSYGHTDKGRTSSISFTRHSAFALLLLFPAFISCAAGHSADQVGENAGIILKTAGFHVSGAEGPMLTDVFIFNDDALKRIDSYQRTTAGNDNTVAAASRKGDKIAVVIANPQHESYDWSSISSYEALTGLYSELGSESSGAPVMSGTVRFRAEDNGTVEVPVYPVMSEITIRSIRCDFSGRPYSHAVLKNACAYLTNVNSLARIIDTDDAGPLSPVNTDGSHTESDTGFLYPEMVYADFGCEIGNETVYPDIRLYCYPNAGRGDSAGTPVTRLVIAGEIEGSRCYYPLNINTGDFGPVSGVSGIGRGSRYILDITIRRAGTDNPLLPVSAEHVSIGAEIEPWEIKESSDVEF